MNINDVLEHLKLAEKFVTEYMSPEDDSTKFVLRVLTNQDTKALLSELCGGVVNLQNLTVVLPINRLKHLIQTAQVWINVQARGQEVSVIITNSGQLTAKERHERFNILIEALKYYGIVSVVGSQDGEHKQYQIDLI